MQHPTPPAVETQQIIALARRFADAGDSDVAVDLLLKAVKLQPTDQALRQSFDELLDEVLRAQRHLPDTTVSPKVMRRNVIDAAHFLGVAQLYIEQGRETDAIECLEVAKARSDTDPLPYKLHGTILFRVENFQGAAEQLAVALRFNPFDREVAELLSSAAFECRDYEGALRATAHAYILVKEGHRSLELRFRRRIQTLRELLGWDRESILLVFKERQGALRNAFERLSWHRERFSSDRESRSSPFDEFLDTGLLPETTEIGSTGRLRVAGQLRDSQALAQISDELIFRLSEATQEELYGPGEQILAAASDDTDLCILVQGRAGIETPSPYGPIQLGEVAGGSLLGETNFILQSRRLGSHIARVPSRVLRIDGERLAAWTQESKELGVQLHWVFWHELAQKLRAGNEQLREIAHREGLGSPTLAPPESPSSAEPVETGEHEKVSVLREQGLSGTELETLAAFARELRYEPGSYVFREGEYGNELFVVLEGRVVISKRIHDGGEEALGVMKRGEFFGEMSLLDGQPRSADARVYREPAVLLAIGRGSVDRVLSLDPQASLALLQLLCRLLAKRLREINHKLVTWQILADQTDSSSASAG